MNASELPGRLDILISRLTANDPERPFFRACAARLRGQSVAVGDEPFQAAGDALVAFYAQHSARGVSQLGSATGDAAGIHGRIMGALREARLDS